MLQDEIKSMLSSVISDDKKISDLYREGYFEYSNNKDCKGNIAVVNNKAVVSILEDVNDESKVIATVNFKNSGTLIYKLFDKNYSFSQIGQDPFKRVDGSSKTSMRSKEEIIKDIESVRKHCRESKEKAMAVRKASLILSEFDLTNICSNSEISEQEILLLLKETINNLNKTRCLKEDESQLEK